MGLRVLKPGMMTTLQGRPRTGLRHQGIPASGPADPLSMALANRLASNAPDTTAIEITLGAAVFEFTQSAVFAVTGAPSGAALSGKPIPMHQTLRAGQGEHLEFGAPELGVRTYLALASGVRAETIFGSSSTFMPARLGGHQGRRLEAGDRLETAGNSDPALSTLMTPADLRPRMSRAHALRASPGPDAEFLPVTVWADVFEASRRMDRTGIEVSGLLNPPSESATRPSAALITGAVQLTPSGHAFILLPDAQTTGGYPHILQVNRADRHILGQIAPGDTIRFLQRSPGEAHADLVAKTALFTDWLPGFGF